MIKKTNKDKIEILKEAKKLVIQGYGKKCPDFDFRCYACIAGITVSFLDEFIGDMKTEIEIEKMYKAVGKKKK